jgi:hypothetical protein
LQKEVLAYYRQHPNSMTKDMFTMIEYERNAHFFIYNLFHDEVEKDKFINRKMNLFISSLIEDYFCAKKRVRQLAKKRSKYKLCFLISAGILLLTICFFIFYLI